MKFYIPDHIMRWLGPGIIMAIGIMVIFSVPVSRSTLCDPEKNCLIAWIGALSGWAALGGALLTVSVIYQQLLEQKRQTKFLLGDEDPEILVISSNMKDELTQKEYGIITVQINNRNRRPIEIDRIYLSSKNERASLKVFSIEGGGLFDILKQKIPKKKIDIEKFEQGFASYDLPGRETGLPIPKCIIKTTIMIDEKLHFLPKKFDYWSFLDVTVTARVFIIDADGRRMTIDARTVIAL